MTYIKEFTAAATRTRKLDLGDITLGEAAMPLDPTVLNAVEATGHIPFPLRAENAFNVNFGMFHMLTKTFHIPGAVLSLGNVAVNGSMLMPVEPSHFKKMVKDKSGEENMGSYHLWTTLPGRYILDHALLSGLHRDGIVSVNEAVPAERYLYGQADELPHAITYHPMVVGLEFFVASETIDREALEYLMGERFPKQYD